MAQDTKIQWTQHTWNPWTGCIKVSAGCKFCYMYRDKERYGLDPTQVIRSKEKIWQAPYTWKPGLVFTCSWSDFFIEQADEWRADAWKVIRNTPKHTYQILTKRPERILECLPPDWGDGYKNVWIGISVENQEAYDLRIPILAQVPAAIRFLSIEPIIGPINVANNGALEYYQDEKINWVIIGGESGNETGKYRYRPCELGWIRNIINDLSAYPKAFIFVKQLGTDLSKRLGLNDRAGGDIDEWPQDIRIRQMPIEP